MIDIENLIQKYGSHKIIEYIDDQEAKTKTTKLKNDALKRVSSWPEYAQLLSDFDYYFNNNESLNYYQNINCQISIKHIQFHLSFSGTTDGFGKWELYTSSKSKPEVKDFKSGMIELDIEPTDHDNFLGFVLSLLTELDVYDEIHA